MRIERLRLQAFGPYVEEQQIDFQALAQKHLFLIRGETGAGKTALLDAITYALYGKSSGGERGDIENMRCRYAQASIPTFVELIFWIQAKRYRFYREVQVRKKRNGEVAYKLRIAAGTFDQDVFLPFFENPKLKLVEEKAEALIGLSHAQFMQVMMLPQGKFEQLLVSKSEEKQEILKTLFQMENWSAICERLSEKLREDKSHIEQLEQQMKLLLKQGEVPSIEDLQATLHQVIITKKVMEEQVQEVKQQVEQWRQVKEEQQQLHTIQKRYQEVEQNYRSLCKSEKEIDHMRKQLKRIEQVTKIKPYYDAYQEADNEVKQRERYLQRLAEEGLQLQQQQDEVEQLQEQLPKQKLAIAKQEQKLHQIKEQCKQLQEIEKLYQTYEQAQQRYTQIEAAYDTFCKQKHEFQQQMEELEHFIQQCEESVSAYPAAVEAEQRYEKGRELHFAIVEQKQQLQQFIIDEQNIQQKLQKAQQKYEEQQKKQEKMYQQYLQNSAAMLAELLEEGKPCPVCGSLHHKKLQQIQGTMIEAKQLQECKKLVDKWQEEVQHWTMKGQENQVHQQQGKTDLLQKEKELYDILPQGYEATAHQASQILLQDCRKQLDLRETYQMQEKQMEQQQVEWKRKQEEQEQQLQKQREATLILQTQWIERKQHVSADFQKESEGLQLEQQEAKQCEELQQQLQQMETKIHTYEIQWQRYISNQEHAKQELQEWVQRKTQAQQAYEAQCDDTLHDVKEADFQHVSYVEWKEQIQAFDTQMLQIQADRKALQQQLEGKQIVDLQQVQQTLQTYELQYEESFAKVHELHHREQYLMDIQTSLQATQEEWNRCRITYGKRSEFVRAMRGDNSIGIERYVLGIMLSSITNVANTLLENVHDGRYRIYRSDASSGRTRKFGLELSIYDAYSCSQRSVVSLSGGEKFLVSLALSLALSTVVQARSGGIVMEAMFIDEGFGSLDEQSIQDALQVLSTMSKNKAMIGIISHVELLKENIPYGILVEKHKEGSQIRMLL